MYVFPSFLALHTVYLLYAHSKNIRWGFLICKFVVVLFGNSFIAYKNETSMMDAAIMIKKKKLAGNYRTLGRALSCSHVLL